MKVGNKMGRRRALTAEEVQEAALEAARRGDLRAWEHIVRLHQELVFRSAYLATRDADLADETTREALVRAYRALPQLPPETDLRPWLMGVAATTARARLREMGQRQDARLPDPDPSPRYAATPVVVGPANHRPTPQEHEALLGTFGAMIDEDRLLIVARYSLGLSRAEAAARLGIPADAVEGRLGVAVSRLRDRLADPSTVGLGDIGTSATPTHAAHLAVLPDDQLGAMAAAAVMSELPWTPDVAPAVRSRLVRDAVAYPEQFALEQRANSAAAASAARIAASSSAAGGASLGSPSAVSRRPRQGGSMVFATLIVFVSVIGIAVASERLGADGQADVSRRVSAVPEQAGIGVAVRELAGVPKAPDPIDASSVAGETENSALATARPVLSVVGGRPFPGGGIGARVVVAWTPDAGLGGVDRLRLQRKIGSGPWKFVSSAGVQGSLGAVLHAGRRYSFRVHAFYGDGRVATSPSMGAMLTVRDSISDRLHRTRGGWRTKARDAVGGSVLASTAVDATISTTFTGSNVALVVATGPSSGSVRTRVDDGPWSGSDLDEPIRSARRVVLSRDLPKGRHSMDIQVDKSDVAIDAVLIVRTYRVPHLG